MPAGMLPLGGRRPYNNEYMQSAHDLYCDRRHPARQRCNDGLAPNGEATVDAGRATIAAGEAPRPTPYAAREWKNTVAALQAPARLAPERKHDEAAVNATGGVTKAALIIAGIALVLLVWWLRRPRTAEAPERA